MNENQLSSYLKLTCRGRKQARTGPAIERTLRISSSELRKLVSRLRRKGIPIASSQEGYFYAATAAEIYATIRQLKGMRDGLDAAIGGLERSLDTFGGDDP